MLSGLRASAVLLFLVAGSEVGLLASHPGVRVDRPTLALGLLTVALEVGLCAVVFRGARRAGDPWAQRAAKAAFFLSLAAGASLAFAGIRGTMIGL